MNVDENFVQGVNLIPFSLTAATEKKECLGMKYTWREREGSEKVRCGYLPAMTLIIVDSSVVLCHWIHHALPHKHTLILTCNIRLRS